MKQEFNPSTQEIIVFLKQLLVFLSAHIPILDCLSLLRSSHHIQFMQTLKYEIESGKGLSSGLKKFPKHFNAMACQLIEMGEKTGTLTRMIEQVIIYYEKSLSMQNKIKQALFYPMIVLITALMVTLIMIIFIVPKFADFFKNMGSAIPQTTQLLIALSSGINHHAGLMITFIMLTVTYFIYLKKHHQLYYPFSFFKKIPFIGSLVHSLFILNFITHLTILYEAGLPLAESLPFLSLTHDPQHKILFQQMKNKMLSGHAFHITLSQTQLFPTAFIQLIKTGEESGTLSMMLTCLMNLYENETKRRLTQLNQWVEPLIMISLGVLIGGLMLMLYLPIFKLGMTV